MTAAIQKRLSTSFRPLVVLGTNLIGEHSANTENPDQKANQLALSMRIYAIEFELSEFRLYSRLVIEIRAPSTSFQRQPPLTAKSAGVHEINAL